MEKWFWVTTPEPLLVRVAGRIRTNDLPIRELGALSAELQPHASGNVKACAD